MTADPLRDDDVHNSCHRVLDFGVASSPARVNIVLDAEYAEKLRVLADRTHVSPGTLARALLSSALDEVDPSPRNVALLLDGIEGAFERAQAGLADVAAGRVIALEDL